MRPKRAVDNRAVGARLHGSPTPPSKLRGRMQRNDRPTADCHPHGVESRRSSPWESMARIISRRLRQQSHAAKRLKRQNPANRARRIRRRRPREKRPKFHRPILRSTRSTGRDAKSAIRAASLSRAAAFSRGRNTERPAVLSATADASAGSDAPRATTGSLDESAAPLSNDSTSANPGETSSGRPSAGAETAPASAILTDAAALAPAPGIDRPKFDRQML